MYLFFFSCRLWPWVWWLSTTITSLLPWWVNWHSSVMFLLSVVCLFVLFSAAKIESFVCLKTKCICLWIFSFHSTKFNVQLSAEKKNVQYNFYCMWLILMLHCKLIKLGSFKKLSHFQLCYDCHVVCTLFACLHWLRKFNSNGFS